MASSEMNENRLSTSYMKATYLNTAIRSYLGIEYFERILQKEGDINYQIPKSNRIGANFNLLHGVSDDYFFEIFKLILDHGADFTIKDCNGRTVIHKIIYDNYNDCKSLVRFRNAHIDTILCAHVKLQNAANPRCDDFGVSHFHAACMTNHVEAVKFFLDSGVAVDGAVNDNSPIYAGFTPLHFAVRFLCLEVADILLKRGANVHRKNIAGMNCMQVLVHCKLYETCLEINESHKRMFKLLLKHGGNRNAIDNLGLSNLHIACLLDETLIVTSILADEQLNVNKAININSEFYPGSTPLHFAATFADIDIVKLLLMKGADIEAKDANNVTFIDLFLQNHQVEDIHFIISSQTKLKDIQLADGKTLLLDLVSAIKSNQEFSDLLAKFESLDDLTVPSNSPLWPDCTILHLAVIFTENIKNESCNLITEKDTTKVEACLARDEVDITKTNANGASALHLAFYSQKYCTIQLLLKHHPTIENPFDSNNLSHFHIACAARNEEAVERFITNGCIDLNTPINSTIKCFVPIPSDEKRKQVFLTPGSTALHINVACKNIEITKILLDNGADIYAKDCNGFTPIHRLLSCSTTIWDNEINNLLLNSDALQDSIADCGLSHLHVTCRLDNVSAVEKLLDSGADVNAVVTYETDFDDEVDRYSFNPYRDPYGDPSKETYSFLVPYRVYTPLHISLKRYNTDIPILLMKRGAEIIGENSINNFVIEQDLMAKLVMDDRISVNQLEQQLGLPMLHIACFVRKLELVEELLLRGDDVNMRYPTKPGNTPLHFALMKTLIGELESTELIKLLLKNGADVMMRNDDGYTALHFLEFTYNENLTDCRSARLLLRATTNFNIYYDPQGISFFHFACITKDVDMIEKFLENGVDVNEPVDHIVDRYAVCSPLHLVTGYRSERFDDVLLQLRIIDLLIKHGVDVHALDLFGNTPLHRSARSSGSIGSSREKIFDILIRSGLDVNAENIIGETPLEVLIKLGNASWVEVLCLLEHGARINSYNPITHEGYAMQIFVNSISEDKSALANDVIRNLINSKYVTEIDNEGRSFIYNLVSIRDLEIEDYVDLIGQLMKRGCKINHQDTKGRTALHIAAWFRNYEGTLGLMRNGADINFTDENGMTAFAYCFESPHNSCLDDNNRDPDRIINSYAMHVNKMKNCGLYTSADNLRFQVEALAMHDLKEDILNRFDEHVETTKSVKIGSTNLTLYDFGFEMDAEMAYPSMSNFVRLEIDQFFENISQHNLYELDYLLKIKHEKARIRMQLINLSIEPFSIIIKNQLPELCCRIITSFLSVADLKNVISTENL